MTDQQIRAIGEAEEKRRLDIMESGVILQLHKIAEAQKRLTSILALGSMDSHFVAAITELRSAANNLEATRKAFYGAEVS